MFTGIIEEMGTIDSVRLAAWGSLTVQAKRILTDIHIGDSIAVNGVCLTVTAFSSGDFTVDVMAETMRRTNLGGLKRGSLVNLERAMAANGRFGGHLVSGHIDGTGTIQSLRQEGNSTWIEISADAPLMKYIVEKGSIAIDGISLTVASSGNESFQVSIIPHTGAETTLLKRSIGDTVNLETDIIGKYIDRLLHGPSAEGSSQSRITEAFLIENGF